MAQKQQIQQVTNTMHATSQLERFTLGFEYDKTLQELKRDMRVRTLS